MGDWQLAWLPARSPRTGLIEHLLGDHHQPRWGHVKTLAVAFRINTDPGAVGDHAVLVDDGATNIAVFTDSDPVQQQAIFDVGAFLDVDIGEQQ